jgi:hypothetical protein
MILEGYTTGDSSKVVAGSKLFEDGRNEVLASVVELGDPNSPESKGLKRVLDAYQEKGEPSP